MSGATKRRLGYGLDAALSLILVASLVTSGFFIAEVSAGVRKFVSTTEGPTLGGATFDLFSPFPNQMVAPGTRNRHHLFSPGNTRHNRRGRPGLPSRPV